MSSYFRNGFSVSQNVGEYLGLGALGHVESAVAAGFDDGQQMSIDPDLESFATTAGSRGSSTT